MKNKYTAAPWEFFTTDPNGFRYADIMGTTKDGKGKLLFQNLLINRHDHTEEGLANAHLVAAAPDLLEAAKECLKCETDRRKDLENHSPAANFCNNRIAKITAAIARAEGGS